MIGSPGYHKGWHIIEDLIMENRSNSDYKFFVFGEFNPLYLDVTWKHVSVKDDGISSMVSHLRKEQINIVILWSLCKETFSYTAHEALAAGSLIITNSLSGNIQAIVKQTGQGLVLTEKELFSYFSSGQIIGKTRSCLKKEFLLVNFSILKILIISLSATRTESANICPQIRKLS